MQPDLVQRGPNRKPENAIRRHGSYAGTNPRCGFSGPVREPLEGDIGLQLKPVSCKADCVDEDDHAVDAAVDDDDDDDDRDVDEDDDDVDVDVG